MAMKRLEELSEGNQNLVISTTKYDDFTATEGKRNLWNTWSLR